MYIIIHKIIFHQGNTGWYEYGEPGAPSPELTLISWFRLSPPVLKVERRLNNLVS